jgi:hypothetical protein
LPAYIRSLSNIITSFSNEKYNDELEVSYAASKDTIDDTMNVLYRCTFQKIIPEPYLFGDGSISLIWNTDNLIAGMRFVGDKCVNCTLRFEDNLPKSHKFNVSDIEDLNNFILQVDKYIF